MIDVHNGGCASFPHMIALAQKILQTTDAKTALVAAVQNAAGPSMTQSEIRKLAFAPVPGDGCGVGLLVKNEDAPVLGVVGRTYPEFAGDMTFEAVGLPKDAVPRKYWQPGIGQPTIGFTESKIAKVFTRGNRLVPEVGYAVLEEIDAKSGDVDLFVSNQPNRLFLRNWHDALEIPAERHPDTFDECGNLFGAGIPVTLDAENRAGRIPNGSLVLMSAFTHAVTTLARPWNGGERSRHERARHRHARRNPAVLRDRRGRRGYRAVRPDAQRQPVSAAAHAFAANLKRVMGRANRYPEFLPQRLPR